MSILKRPLCWLLEHDWHEEEYRGRNPFALPYWVDGEVCQRCGKKQPLDRELGEPVSGLPVEIEENRRS